MTHKHDEHVHNVKYCTECHRCYCTLCDMEWQEVHTTAITFRGTDYMKTVDDIGEPNVRWVYSESSDHEHK